MGDTYHGLDYPMFHMDIRENAILRVNTYLAQNAVETVDQAIEQPGEANPSEGD